jgi:hypothetical protein
MSETRFPDIAIYLPDTPKDRILEWLERQFPDATMRTTHADVDALRLELDTQGDAIPVALFFDAVPGYTVVWFDTASSPWATDLDCARTAARDLGCEVRCSTGSWSEEDKDLWWRVEGGMEERIRWR